MFSSREPFLKYPGRFFPRINIAICTAKSITPLSRTSAVATPSFELQVPAGCTHQGAYGPASNATNRIPGNCKDKSPARILDTVGEV